MHGPGRNWLHVVGRLARLLGRTLARLKDAAVERCLRLGPAPEAGVTLPEHAVIAFAALRLLENREGQGREGDRVCALVLRPLAREGPSPPIELGPGYRTDLVAPLPRKDQEPYDPPVVVIAARCPDFAELAVPQNPT